MLTRKNLLAGVCVLLLTAANGPALGQSLPGMYIRGDVGWSATTNANIHDRNAADHVILGNLSDIGSGWFAGGCVGAPIIPGFRGEIAYTYHGGYHLDELDHGTPQARFRADI